MSLAERQQQKLRRVRILAEGRAGAKSNSPSRTPYAADPTDTKPSRTISENQIQVREIVAHLIKNGKLTMEDVQRGLDAIEEGEFSKILMVQILIVEAVEILPTHELQDTVIDLIENMKLAKQTFESDFCCNFSEVGMESIEMFSSTDLRRATIDLVKSNIMVVEHLMEKLLIKQEDGSFILRKFDSDDVIHGSWGYL